VAINVDLVADASKAIKEAGKLGDALDDVADNLADMGKEGKTIDDKVTDAFRNVGKEAKDAGRDIGTSVKDGTDKANEGFSEMKDEAAGTAREAAASFSSLEDVGDVVQESLANMFAGLGPAGMAAGILAAAGVGLAISALTEQADAINTNKEKMLSLAQTIRDNGGALTESDYIAQMDEYGYAIQDTKEWFEVFQKDAVSGFEELKKIQDDTGLSAKQMYRAGFGDAQDARKTLQEITTKIGELKDKKDAIYQTSGSILEPVDAHTLESLEKARELVQGNIDAQEAAEAVEKTRRESIEGTAEAMREDIQAKEAAQDAEADLAKYIVGTTENYRDQVAAIQEATGATKDQITSELDFMDAQENLNTKLTDSKFAWDTSTVAGRDNQRAVIDLANGIEDMAQKQIDAGGNIADVTTKFNAQKDALINQVTPAFGGSREAAALYIEQILKTPPVVRTDVNLNGIPDAEEQLNDFLRKPRSVGVMVNPDFGGGTGTSLDKYIGGLQGRVVYMDVRAKNGEPINA